MIKTVGFLTFLSTFLVPASARIGYVVRESFAEQFLGSPLLSLTTVLVIAAVASLYYRLRK